MSNAVTSGCFQDQTYSPSTNNEAGEADATNDGFSGGLRQNHYEAQWQFASTVPGAEQPGLNIIASPNRGDTARMSYVRMDDTPTGLAVNFISYRDVAPYGSIGDEANGCGAGDDFVTTLAASGLNRTQPHTIRIVIDFLNGPRNDVVRLYVDNVLRLTDTSWEDYFRWCEATGDSRTVDSLFFHARGTAAPATLGNGFLIDNLSVSTSVKPYVTLVSKDEVIKQTPFQSTPYDDGWTNRSIRITLACVDPSGVTPTSFEYWTVTQETDTEHFKTNADCASPGGTYAEPIDVGDIHIDKTKPIISSSRNPGGSGWVNEDILVSFTCFDPGPVPSGIGTDTVADVLVTTNVGSITSGGSCIDNAGNSASQITVNGLKIDKTLPTCTLKLTKPANPNGTMKGASVKVSAADNNAGSGVASNSIRLVSITPSGTGAAESGWDEGTGDTSGNVATINGTTYTWVYSVDDNAGNTGTCSASMSF